MKMKNSETGELKKVAYGVAETAMLLSVGRTSLYKLQKQGHLSSTKIGRKTLFLREDIQEFLIKLRAGGVK